MARKCTYGKEHLMKLREKINDVAPALPREMFFEDLYEKAFPVFARFAARLNASLEDAKDIFHDALVVFYEKSQDPCFSIRTTSEAYVVGIAKHLWIRKFNHDRQRVSFDETESEIILPTDEVPTVNEIRLLEFLQRTGKKCLELLRNFYYDNADLRAIASRLGYRSEHSAAVQKYKCIGKLRDAIKEKSLDYGDFFN